MPSEMSHKNPVKGRAVLCMLKTNVHDHTVYKIKLNELRTLVESLGINVVSEMVQTRHKQFERYCIGKGKVKELQQIVEKKDINIVVFYNLLKSSQKLNLIKEVKCDVIDRYELTLQIFEEMASDNLSKLQIESARLEKLTPFYKLAANLNFTHDRPFFHGGGEYAFRSQLREISRRRADIKREIESLMNEKKRQIEYRKKLGYPIICIAGYYNAGKTSLFNVLTGEKKLVTDRPFTTMSSKYQKRYIDSNTTVLFIDTIGFVLDLDHRLIKSFQINFEDIRSADLVALLFEITDEPFTLRLKMNEGLSLLRDIGVNLRRILFVFNKVDLSPTATNLINEQLNLEQYDIPWTYVSATKRINIDGLLNLISNRLKEIKETPDITLKPIEIPNSIIYPKISDPIDSIDITEDDENGDNES